jgi:acetylornithine deacetylase/succinyl-diaminopimelate desuccinylase-like protein
VLAEVAGRPLHPGAGAEYYERNGADASLDVTEVVAGEPRTIVPAHARASFAMRLAPGQEPEAIRVMLERLLRAAVPEGAEVQIEWEGGSPALFPPDEPAIARAVEALERATGTRPALVRSGGSIPVVAELGRRMPVVVTGFVLPDDAFHAPDESYRLEALDLGLRSARELLAGLADLRSTPSTA